MNLANNRVYRVSKQLVLSYFGCFLQYFHWLKWGLIINSYPCFGGNSNKSAEELASREEVYSLFLDHPVDYSPVTKWMNPLLSEDCCACITWSWLRDSNHHCQTAINIVVSPHTRLTRKLIHWSQYLSILSYFQSWFILASFICEGKCFSSLKFRIFCHEMFNIEPPMKFRVCGVCFKLTRQLRSQSS